MEPTILEDKIFRILGCVFYGDPFHKAVEWSYENEIGKLWQRFMKLNGKYSSLLSKICVDRNIGYEIHLEPEEYKDTRKYFVLVGVEVKDIEEIPLEMFVKILPKTDYVVFTTTMENKLERGGYIYKKWLPENGYAQAFPYIIQLYDNRRYKGLEYPESELDWFIPIKKAR
ncbi:MAG: GyrI-like domain-containing protein [Candidatus Hodarchaeales archaeon]|jgi:AraC family transcriptional regulator